MEQLTFNFFSTRETATVFWVTFLLIWLILYKNFGKQIINLLKILFNKSVLIYIFSLSITLLIFGILLYISLSFAELWRIEYIKTIVLWDIFVGANQTIDVITKGLKQDFFKIFITDSFTYAAIIGFITSYFTFNLIIELILIPFFFIIFSSGAMLEFKEKESPNTKIVQNFIIFLAIIFFSYTCLIVIKNYSSLNIVDILMEFFIPILLSLFFIPFIYFWAIYSKYEIIITRLKIKDVIKKENRLLRIFEIIKACGISYNTLINFEKNCVNKMYCGTSDVEFCNIIRNFVENSK